MPRIALCICTYDRPAGLSKLLDALTRLRDRSLLCGVVVVDNHPAQAGRAICESLSGYPLPLVCVTELRPGISHARNAAVRQAFMAQPDFIAMIDDDEWPDENWLSELLAAQEQQGVDIVWGRVEPHFEHTPPRWAQNTGLFRSGDCPKTSSVLFRAEIFREFLYPWFDPRLGASGGEDTEFILRVLEKGRRSAYAPQSLVHETVPESRTTWRYVARRGFRMGAARIAIQKSALSRLAHIAGAFPKFAYGLNHAFWSLFRSERFTSAIDDISEGIGRLSGIVGYLPDFYGVTSVASPAVHLSKPALKVACYDNWGDLDDAMFFLTPEGKGVWNDVAFVRAGTEKPDWIGVFNHPGEKPVRLNFSPNRIFFAQGEPPAVSHRDMHLGQVDGSHVLTSQEEFCITPPAPRNYVLEPTLTRTWWVRRTLEELRAMKVEDKPRALSWITSNLTAMPGHRYRMAFVEKLRGKLEFDLFGRGFQPLTDKWNGLASYRYSIAFENTSAPYYFTEKLMDCFVAETMPIYYGSPRITEFFPADSMLILDPEDPDAIAKISDAVASDLWLRRRDAVREAKALVLEKYNMFARLAAFVRGQADAPMPPEPVVVKRVQIDLG